MYFGSGISPVTTSVLSFSVREMNPAVTECGVWAYAVQMLFLLLRHPLQRKLTLELCLFCLFPDSPSEGGWTVLWLFWKLVSNFFSPSYRQQPAQLIPEISVLSPATELVLFPVVVITLKLSLLGVPAVAWSQDNAWPFLGWGGKGTTKSEPSWGYCIKQDKVTTSVWLEGRMELQMLCHITVAYTRSSWSNFCYIISGFHTCVYTLHCQRKKVKFL